MTIKIQHGDCTQKLQEVDCGTIDAIISDPPYGLKFMNKEFDDLGQGSQQREWHKQWLQEAYKVLKPGGVIKAFSGTRTYHHLVKAMMDCGFKQVTVQAWVYGSGFPKSLNIAKKFDQMAGVQGDIIGTNKGVGGENINDIVAGTTDQEGGKGVGAYGTGAKQVTIDIPIRELVTQEAKMWNGWGTSLKPSFEPVVIGFKPE